MKNKELLIALNEAWNKGLKQRKEYGWHSNPFSCKIMKNDTVWNFETLKNLEDAFDFDSLIITNSKNNKTLKLNISDLDSFNILKSFFNYKINKNTYKFDLGI